ncbi:MAG: hypothetical protein P8N02_20010 [Actinomycetota bacterium]|jgi:hypothetical protein|nr:hypothetical protein [Actinomycetota bacterium]
MAVDTLVGRLVDLTGRQSIADRQLALVARLADPSTATAKQPSELLASAVTADDGTFITARPPGSYVDAFVVLDDGSGRLHLELELDGTFPEELVVFLNELESHLRYAN